MQQVEVFDQKECPKQRARRLGAMFKVARLSKMLPLEAAALKGQIKISKLLSLEEGKYIKMMPLQELWNLFDRLDIELKIEINS